MFFFFSDKLELQEYLREAYTSARRLDVPLLPEWGQLHVSQIFSPAILAGDKGLRSYKEIFCKDGKLQKRVVLLGEAGRGKSTFCKHLTDIWQVSTSVSQFRDIDVLKQFDYLFYVSCRFAKEKETLLDMITYQLFGDDKMNVAKVARYVLQNLPDLCLIIVDGFDEWAGTPTSETGRMRDVAGLPGLAGVEDCIILITSRPWRFNSLSPQAQKIFMRLNIDGIKDVKELSQQVLDKLGDREPVKSADEFLRQVYARNMYDLMKNPLILIIALRGWVGDNDDETVRSLHKSMCINYINMIQSLISRSKGQAGWSSSESKLPLSVPSYENLESEWGKKANELPIILSRYKVIQRYAGLLLSVGQLAFELLLGREEQSLVFSKTKLKKYLPEDDENDESINVCLAMGILSKTETTFHDLKKLESYAFCHKTFQEFFAALWLASKYQTEKNKLYQCIKSVKDLQGFEMLIQFLCGFDPAIGKQIWLYLSEEVEMGYQLERRRYQLERRQYQLGRRQYQLERRRYQLERRLYPWEQVQKLACRCMKEHEVDLKDQKSSQVYFCIPHITIKNYTSDEDIELLCHVMEEYYSNVKSVEVYDRESQQQVQNIYKSISYCSGLRVLRLQHLPAVSSVLDLQKHNKLEGLELRNVSVEGLLLPEEGATITTLWLGKVTMTHHGLEQLEKLSSYTNLETLSVIRVSCSDNDSVCIPVLDLRQLNKLERLELEDISVKGLLLPEEGATITTLWLDNVTMTHHSLKQLEKLSSYTNLETLLVERVSCSDNDSVCIPVLNLRQHNKLETLKLWDISVEDLLLPGEGATITTLWLGNVTMTHHSLKQLEKLSSYTNLETLLVIRVSCSDNDSVCIPVLNLRQHNKLERLELENISVEDLLLPVEGATITSLWLDNVTMTHHGLEQLLDTLPRLTRPQYVILNDARCREHGHYSSCKPLQNIYKIYKRWKQQHYLPAE